MIIQRFLLAFILFIVSTFGVHAGIELRSHQIKTSDGLPSNTVRYIYQDSKGFLWLGTLNGLSRYDGNSFLTFQPGNGEQPSLADNRIFNITEDKHGFLWMGTTVRLYSCYDLRKACFVNYMEPEEQDRNYSKLFLASCGDVWLWHPDNGSRRVVHQQNGSLTSTVFKTEAGNLPDNRVNFVREDNKGRIWIGTKRGLALVVNGEVKIVNRALHFVSLLANGNTVYFLTEDGDIYSYQEEVYELVKQASLSSIAGKTSFTDDFRIKDKWMILTTTGIYNYDLVTYTLTTDPRLNIKNGEVICDNHGDFWIYNGRGKIISVDSRRKARPY